jgi:hypothetical protein
MMLSSQCKETHTFPIAYLQICTLDLVFKSEIKQSLVSKRTKWRNTFQYWFFEIVGKVVRVKLSALIMAAYVNVVIGMHLIIC